MSPESLFNTQKSRPTFRSDSARSKTKAILPNQYSVTDAIANVRARIAPVWPLEDYVAVNPYMGFSEQEFLRTREHLRTLSDLELFMPIDYYREQYQQGKFQRADISNAVDELVADGVDGAERIDVNQVIKLLKSGSTVGPTADSEFVKSDNPDRTLFSFTEMLDRHQSANWGRRIDTAISKQCASYYDQGQAIWASNSKDLPLFNAWRSEKLHDRTFEILGVAGFRRFVADLPHQPETAIENLLDKLGVPVELREDYLLCLALHTPGWSAWTTYQHRKSSQHGQVNNDFAGLLAMRLAYEVALSEHSNFSVNWGSYAADHLINRRNAKHPSDQDLWRYALLRASEIAFRNEFVDGVKHRLASTDAHGYGDDGVGEPLSSRKLAQMVFCIDVRSERMRRHLEQISPNVDTYGFAGFFGVPMEYVELGADRGDANVPVLIAPQFKVHQQVESCDSSTSKAIAKRGVARMMRKAWRGFQSSAVSMFGFVETTGLLYGLKLLSRSLGWKPNLPSSFDGLSHSETAKLSPSLRELAEQGITIDAQIEMAESILRGIGTTDNFARLVVLCGHESCVENNPLKAALDCGACGGHSGEPNARFAAKLLNLDAVRKGLAARGIHIPEDTMFVSAVHVTTTDCIKFLDRDDVPDSHRADLQQLAEIAARASEQTRHERLLTLPGRDSKDLDRRSADWSEVRPEWGLAGNAAFIAAPRSLTRELPLDAKSFLHSYDYREDRDFQVLEQIMTAPLVVASWINLQYFASTVDPIHFGSGNKTVHNVVGRFGIFSGNGGDLKTGLPWQSIHDGKRYQHHPLRLLAVLAAPTSAIEAVLEKHEDVANLVTNGWIQLLAVDESKLYRFNEQQGWDEMVVSTPQPNQV